MILIKKNRIILIATVAIILFLSGCSMQQPRTNQYEQICVSHSIKISNLLNKASKVFRQDYKFDGESNNDITIPINNKTYCFNSLNDISNFIKKNTGYSLQLNTEYFKGILVYDSTIKQVFNYLRAKGLKKKIIFIGSNLRLKDNSKLRINTMDELKKYISKTTPLYLTVLSNSKKNTIYALKYKKISSKNGSVGAIIIALKEAINLVKENNTISLTKRRKVIKRINNSIKGILNYEN